MPFEDPSVKRVLIVEDEALIALDLEHRLRRLGFEVVGVADHRDEAVALFAETKPDFVLMDIVLRGREDGIAMAQAIGDSSDVPVIFLTAFADDATIGRASEVSPYGYIIKPIDERALVATISMTLARLHVPFTAEYPSLFSKIPYIAMYPSPFSIYPIYHCILK